MKRKWAQHLTFWTSGVHRLRLLRLPGTFKGSYGKLFRVGVQVYTFMGECHGVTLAKKGR